MSSKVLGAKKTEHSGAKKGYGAYWGRKVAAKNDSNRKRLENDKARVQLVRIP